MKRRAECEGPLMLLFWLLINLQAGGVQVRVPAVCSCSAVCARASPLICVVVHCLCTKSPDRRGVGREQSSEWGKHKKVGAEVSMRSNRGVIRSHVSTELYILIGDNSCRTYVPLSHRAQVLLIINASYHFNTWSTALFLKLIWTFNTTNCF